MSNDNTHPSLFEDLPIEIVQQIFAFLPLQELVKAFSGLNFYINSIIRSTRGLSHMVRYNNMDMICLLYLFPAQISRLLILHTERVDFSSLINLRSLTLKCGTRAQFNSLRPHHFPMLEILHIDAISRSSSTIDTQAINDLFQVILSNGFPRLRICTAVRLGTLESSETWVGSRALRSLQLDMKTTDDYEQLLSACPNLRRFTSLSSAWIDPLEGKCNIPCRRIIWELKKIEQLEFEGRFILDVAPMGRIYSRALPRRFNSTPTTQQWRTENRATFQGRISPMSRPYCDASFLIEIQLSPHYPFKQPEVIFLDPIYHPNVSPSGTHCCHWGMSDDMWLPATPLADVILAVLHVIENPDPKNHTNAERIHEYRSNYRKFYKKALKMTLMYGRPRL